MSFFKKLSDLFKHKKKGINEELPLQEVNDLDNETAGVKREDISVEDEVNPYGLAVGDLQSDNIPEKDDELKAIIEKDALEDKLVDFNPDIEYIKEVDVYDTIEREMESDYDQFLDEVSEIKDDGKHDKLSILKLIFSKIPKINKLMMILIGAAGILLIVIIALVIYILVLNGRIKEDKTEGINISQSINNVNNANFIYVNEAKLLDGEKIVLQKINIDKMQTVFYFNPKFDYTKYNITLTDGNDRIIPFDLFYLLNETAYTRNTILYFQGLDNDVDNLTLTIENPETTEKIEFKYNLEKDFSFMPVRWEDNHSEVLTPHEVRVRVEQAVFSSTMSSIYFSFQSPNNNMTIAPKEGASYDISLKEGSKMQVRRMANPILYSFDNENTIVGRYDFQAFSNLAATANITFKDLYGTVELNAVINTEDMFVPGENRERRINVGGYNVVLEGIKKESSYYVLVAHAEDPTVFSEDNEVELDNRIAITLDAELSVKSADGEIYVFEGTNMYKGKSTSRKEGCDTLFDISEVKNELIGTPISDIILTIHSVSFKLDDINISIDLANAKSDQSEKYTEALELITEAFNKRIEYFSGKTNDAELSKYFASDVLKDSILMKYYDPTTFSGYTNYSVQVVSAAQKEELWIAVVQEMIMKNDNGKQVIELQTHKVTLAMQGELFVILNDEIIIE